MSCTNPIYINTTNVNNFGFSTVFDPYLKTVTFDITDYTEFKTGGEANITAINFEVTDPQENVYTGTINPSNSETTLVLSGLVSGLLYFGTYHVKGTLVEADAITYEIEFDIEICDSDLLQSTNYIKGCINAEANCLTAQLTITDQNAYTYNKITADVEKDYNAKIWMPNDPDGGLEEFELPYLPYVKNLSGYYTGKYQISVTSVAYYTLDCGVKLAITYKASMLKNVDCTASICELNCCWHDSLAIAEAGGQAGAQMQDKLDEAKQFYLAALGGYICGENVDTYIAKVNEILNCACSCRQYIIQPAPITLGQANVLGLCGTTVSKDENGDITIHSFVYQVVKGNPNDEAFIFTTTQPNSCTKRTTITFDYDVMQQYILNAIANNPTFILNWQTVLGINDCPCEDVEMTNEPDLLEVIKSDDYTTLEDTYFTKSQGITGVKYKDNSAITGGDINVIEYIDQLISQTGIVQTAGDEITLPCVVCGASIAEKTGFKLITIINSTCGCREVTTCDIDTPRVDYSERYSFAYRWNPHMSVPNYRQYTNPDGLLITEIYYNDVNAITTGTSDGGFIRKSVLSTNTVSEVTTLVETRTLSGRYSVSLTPSTYSGNWGNEVEYFYPSSVNPDFNEIVNGEPVLYFSTFGGVICRMVRERCSECDERANWKTYVIGGLNTPLAGTGANPLAAGSTMAANSYSTGTTFYGMKSFITDENNNMTFMLADFTSGKVFSMWFSGTGNKNNGADWVIGNPAIQLPSNSPNINCEFVTESDPSVGRTMIWSFGAANGTLGIRCSVYTGANTLADLADNTNYATHDVCVDPSGGPTTYTDGTGNVATVSVPHCLSKIGGAYYFCNDFTLSATSASYLRYFTKTGGDSSSGYTFATEVVVNNGSPYESGTYTIATSSAVSAANQGLIEIANVGVLGMFFRGMRFFEFNSTSPRYITVFSGQEVANGDLVDDGVCDTQYSYEISGCEGGSGE